MPEVFAQLEERFHQVRRSYPELIMERKLGAEETVIAKGRMYNVLPFESERTGDKLSGKPLDDIIMHNECYIYHLDGGKRVLLCENISPFLGGVGYNTLYSYGENWVERIYGDTRGPMRVEWMNYSNGQAVLLTTWAKKARMWEEYHYSNDGLLTSMEHFQQQHGDTATRQTRYEYCFNAQNDLTLIQRIWPNGNRETVFSTAKVPYKKIAARVSQWALAQTEQLVEDNRCEKFTRFAFDTYTGHTPSYLVLCLDNEPADADTIDSTPDWMYGDFASCDLVDFPLDDAQIEHLQAALAKVLVDLAETQLFQRLRQYPGFRMLFFDHNGEVAASNKQVAKLLSTDEFLTGL